MFTAELRGKRVEAVCDHRQWQRHMDEVYVNINGVTRYHWRMVDPQSEVLESVVTKNREHKAGLKLLKKSTKQHGRRGTIVTD